MVFSVSVHVLYSDVHAAGAGHVHARGRGTPVFCPSDQDEMDVNFELVYLGYQVVRIFSIGIASYGTGMGILVGVLNCVQIVVPVLNMFWFSMQ